MFNWNLNTILTRYLYRDWRKPKFIAYLQSIGSPLSNLFQRFSAFRNLWNHKLKFTDQIIYLEHYLNGEYSLLYDIATRYNDIAVGSIIWIENAEFIQANTVYNLDENKVGITVYNTSENTVGNVTYNTSDYAVSEHFIVWVPQYITFSENHMRAKIAFYLKAGKQYSIQTY